MLPIVIAAAGLVLHPLAPAAHPSAYIRNAERHVTHPRATICMVERRASNAEVVAEMPKKLADWGCDEALWDGLRSKGRKDLKKLAKNGKEQLARDRIEKLRKDIASQATATSVAEQEPKAEAESKADAEVDKAAATASVEKAEAAAAAKAAAEEAAAVAKAADVEAAAAATAAEVEAAPDGFEWGGTF